MDISYYKEIEITLNEIMNNLDTKFRYNLKFDNIKGFEIIVNEVLKEFYDLIEAYKDKMINLDSFKKLKELIK